MEEVLNQFLEAESSEILKAKPHERNGDRTDYRNGSRERNLTLHRFSKSTVSKLCKELDVPVNQFQHRPLQEPYPFVIVDAMYLKVREDHRVLSKGLFVALGINEDGYKEIIVFDVYDGQMQGTVENS